MSGVGYLGDIPEEVWGVLQASWDAPIHISGNTARAHAIPIAFAASMGWLSNINPDGRSYDRRWHLTPEGEVVLRQREAMSPRTRT